MRKFFVLEIEMERESTRSAHGIALVLREVVSQVNEHRMRPDKPLMPVHSRAIKDANGNTVGQWNVEFRNDKGERV